MARKINRRPEDQSGAAAAVIFEQSYAEDSRLAHRIQPPFVVRQIAARFCLPFATATTVAELAGFRAGGVA